MTGFWRGAEPLLLASTSLTRRLILERAGLAPAVADPGIDERAIQRGLGPATPDAVAATLASAKALAVSSRHEGRVVVGADQILVCDGTIATKAPDLETAAATLLRLAGRTHRLVSAVTVAVDGKIVGQATSAARMTMRGLSAGEIDAYLSLAGASALRSVGCYEIEGAGIHLFDTIEGEYSTILGLPMLPLLDILRERELVAP